MLIMTTTLTATSMSTAEQRLRLMQLASSNLPVGGYSWSQGLEWAVEAGWVPDVAAFERWQRRQMTEGFFTVDLPLFARLYRACEQGDIAAAQRWTAYLLACRETRELREEERNRGAAFARLLGDWQPDCPPPWRTLCQQSQPEQPTGNPFDQSSQPQQPQQQQPQQQNEKKDSDGVAGWIKDMFGSN